MPDRVNEEKHIDNYPDYIEKEFIFDISSGFSSERIDVFLTNNIRNATRTKVQRAVEEGAVTINGQKVKSNRKIKSGDRIICRLLKPPPIELIPENIALDIIFEDEYLMVVNKPAGMVSHPAFGNRTGTLVNGVLFHLGYRDSIKIESESEENPLDEKDIFESDEIRPGLINRLDKDTSGIILLSKNTDIHVRLAKQFADRKVTKYYKALVWGKFDNEHRIYEGNIGRSQRDRKLFSVVKSGGKEAKTEFTVEKSYGYISLVKVKLWTGRTHQIRVHFSNDNHPVLGDEQYGGNTVVLGGNNVKFRNAAISILNNAQGQFLHSHSLKFYHPAESNEMYFEAPLPENFKKSLDILDEYITKNPY